MTCTILVFAEKFHILVGRGSVACFGAVLPIELSVAAICLYFVMVKTERKVMD